MNKKLLILTVVIGSSSLIASDKHFAKTGSDLNSGATNFPYLTVQKAIDNVRAGDTVYCQDATAQTYAENTRNADWAGSVGNYITINGAAKDGTRTKLKSVTWEEPFIRFINLDLSYQGASIFGGQLYVAQNGSSCILSNCYINNGFTNSGQPTIKWNGAASYPFGTAGSDNLIISNTIINIQDEMVFRIHGSRNIISGNQILNLDNTDFFQVFGGTNSIVNNICSNNFVSGSYTNNHADFFQAFCDAGGTFIGTMGHLIESNIVSALSINCQLGNLTDDSYAYAGDITFRNNQFIGVSSKIGIAMPNVKFYNNTFYNCATNADNGGPLLIFSDVGSIGHGHGGRCFNNNFINCGIEGNTNNGSWGYYFETTLTNVAADYNFVAKVIGGQYKSFVIDASHRAVGAGGGWDKFSWWEPNGINGTIKNIGGVSSTINPDPMIISLPLLNFKLTSTSPLKATGLNLTNFTIDIRGVTRSAWDIGAYAYNAADFNTYPCDVTPRLIQAYTLAASNATTVVIPANIYRIAINIDRRTYTNNPNQWPIFTNIYSLSSASVSNFISFTDTNIAGVAYEYRIRQTINTNQICGETFGYIDYQYPVTGYGIPLFEAKGSVCLLVESNYNSASGVRVAQLKSDLIGAGYKVYPHTNIVVSEVTSAGTTWTNAVWSTKQLIQTDYNVNTNTRLYVLMIGHIPVPYSMNLSSGSHLDNIGANGSDLFYADLNGTFTDSTVSNTSAGATFTWNIPGDGKFDQDYIPSLPEVILGRVDLGYSNMTCFTNTEIQRLNAYLDRNHSWRTKGFTARNQAIIYYGGDTNLTVDAKPLEDNNRFVGLLGNTTSTTLGNWLPNGNTTNTSFLFAAEQGAGYIDGSYQLGSSTNFAQTNFYGVFTATYGSYYGSWDSMNTNAFIKTVLGNDGYTLSTWYHENYMLLESSSINEPIGYEQFAMQSQRFFIGSNKEYTWYDRIVPFTGTFGVNGQHKMWESLMGDPTLLVHQVGPASNLVVTNSGADNLATWTASTDTETVGYHIYRAPQTDLNSFTRLTTNPTTSTTYTDTGAASSGPHTYMVRTIALVNNPNRTYYAAAQGTFANVTSGGGGTSNGPQLKPNWRSGTINVRLTQ